MRFSPHSLRFKLLLASTLVEALMLSLLLANSMRLIDRAMLASADAALKQTTPMLNVATAPYLVQGDYATLQDNLNEIIGGIGQGVVYVVVRDLSGRVVAKAGAVDPAALPKASGGVEDALTASVLHVERPLSLAGQAVGELRFGLSTGIIAAAKASLFEQGSAIALVEIAATFILLSLLGYWLTRNLARFVDISRAIADGRYDVRLPEKGRDEVAHLARNFNRMGEAIERQIAELHASEHEFRALFEQAAVGMAHVGFAGEWLRANDKLREILGYAGDDLYAARLPCALCHDDETADAAMRAEMIAGRRAACHCERQLARRDGSLLWVRLTVSPVHDEADRPRYLFVVVQDVDAERRASEELAAYRNELETLVAQRTSALVAANKELETFSYSVSHDLRAPLRAVDGYSQVLLEDYAGQLDGEARHYLQRSRRAVGVMTQLIDGLLDLSRLTRAELCRAPTDLSALALAIAAELESARSADRPAVEFVCAPGLTAVADVRLLRVALLNLLGNAWKFAGKAAQPRVEFGADQSGGKTTFFVRDNGVGFDMAYADKLFAPFQRLHRADEFEGTGIGLATVQRIVHRHGGELRATAAVGSGATFFFTLPCAT